MKRITLPLLLLLLASLACSLTNKNPPGNALVMAVETVAPTPQSSAPMKPTIQPSPTPQAATLPACKVTTGYPEGTVNLRACAGLACQVVAVLSEGDELTVLTPLSPNSGGWLEVKSFAGLRGFIHAKYCAIPQPTPTQGA